MCSAPARKRTRRTVRGPLIRPLAWPTLGGAEPRREGDSFTFQWCAYYHQLTPACHTPAAGSDQSTGSRESGRGENAALTAATICSVVLARLPAGGWHLADMTGCARLRRGGCRAGCRHGVPWPVPAVLEVVAGSGACSLPWVAGLSWPRRRRAPDRGRFPWFRCPAWLRHRGVQPATAAAAGRAASRCVSNPGPRAVQRQLSLCVLPEADRCRQLPRHRSAAAAAAADGDAPFRAHARPVDPGEVLASFTLAQDNGVRVGSVIRVPLVTPVGAGRWPGRPVAGLHPALRVVGIVAAESEFPAGLARTTTCTRRQRSPRRSITARRCCHLSYVRLRHGAADLPRL